MPTNEIQASDYGGTASRFTNDFERLGHPGKWSRIIQVNSGSVVDFTGSYYGAGGLITPTGTTGTVTLSGGGTASLATIISTNICELSVASVNVTAGGPVYVLIRNQARN